MGGDAVPWLDAQPGHEGLIVATDGTATPTSRFYRRTWWGR